VIAYLVGGTIIITAACVYAARGGRFRAKLPSEPQAQPQPQPQTH
jgi:hypothetical protein